MKCTRTWRPILLLGVILVALAWPAPGQEIEDDGALEDTIRGQREQKPIAEAPVTDAPATETKQPSDTIVPPGGEVGRPDADVTREGPVDRERPPDGRELPTPDEQQRGRAREPEQDPGRKRKLAEKLERERILAREKELEEELQEMIRREDKTKLEEEKIGLDQGKQPLDPKGLDVTDQTLVAPGVGKGTTADTERAAVPHFDIVLGSWLPSINIQAGDFGAAQKWSLTDDIGVDRDQGFSEFSVHYRGGRHSFFLSTWTFGFDGQGTTQNKIDLLDVDNTPQTFLSGTPVTVEGEITNLTVKYSLAVRKAAKFRLHLMVGGTYLLLSNVIFDDGVGPTVTWEADFFTPFYGGRVELGPRRLHFYLDGGAYTAGVGTVEIDSFVGEAGVMWAPARWIAVGGGYRVLDITTEETEVDLATNESFFGDLEFEGGTFWLKFIF